MEMIRFKVQGSAAEPYVTTFSRIGVKLAANCSCPAGKTGVICKHRLNILQGNSSAIVSENVCDVQQLLLWLKDTTVADALRQLQHAENQFNAAKKNLENTKRKLANVLAF